MDAAAESLLVGEFSGRPGDDARVVQAADFGFAQAEDVEQNLVGVLAQSGAGIAGRRGTRPKSSGVAGIR
jgi:hypothetical protein